MSTVAQPQQIPLERFVDRVRTISEGVITRQILCDLLTGYEIAPPDLAPYTNWDAVRHTRNLIFRNEMIELMVLCWNVGNTTPLHTHNGQLGWMTMVEGKLRVENFRVRSCNKPENQEVVGMDCLAGATSIDMQTLNTEIVVPGGPVNTVDKHRTIHRITNDPAWNQPAVSLHIYSKPIDSCVVFDLENQRCYRRDLFYDNVP